MKVRSKKKALPIGAHLTRWKDRRAAGLSNGIIEVVALEGGGHVASLNFVPGNRKLSPNVLWAAPWTTVEPGTLSEAQIEKRYGSGGAGKFLASYTGHALCLDYFGAPSATQSARGFPLHGEAACLRWKLNGRLNGKSNSSAIWKVRLPDAGLSFEREINLRPQESVAMFKETIRNERRTEHTFHWVQHATFGPPFLDKENSRLFISGHRARTWPHGYEGKSLLKPSAEFTWPLAPREEKGTADLSIPFGVPGKGFIASVKLNGKRGWNCVGALNWKLGLLAGYFFRGEDFPWVAVWEENCCRTEAPWLGKTKARGMEFGTTPMPIGKDAMFREGKILGKEGWTKIAGRGVRTAQYVAFLTVVPKNWRAIRSVEYEEGSIVIRGMLPSQTVRIAAYGLQKAANS
jgi:hypothetical protein